MNQTLDCDRAGNRFKTKLAQGHTQIGLWLSIADAYAAEIAASCGFDWLLIDGEHAPNELRDVLAQLQAVAPYPAHAVVRPVEGTAAIIKRYLDLGAQTLLVPMVETAEQAAEIVAATRYAPRGIRGVGAAAARASRWNADVDYAHRADKEICVLLQIESTRGLANLDAIAGVDGVDGLFVGPADLAASMGLLGQASHLDVQSAVATALTQIRSHGKFAGVLSADPAIVRRYIEAGAQFVAVGADVSVLAGALRKLSMSYRT
jgi:4-hydroxy-2-oxoheptanedioate aldolase